MKLPNFQKEKSLARKGCKIIIGIDEAGRGPLAGPVTAAAIILPYSRIKRKFSSRIFASRNSKLISEIPLKDSKKLSPKKREGWYKILTRNPRIRWAVASVGPRMIDKINVARAANLAANRAFWKLITEIFNRSARRQKISVLLDGGLYLSKILDSRFYFLNSQTIIRGDEKCFVIAAASVIAKVTRDRKMRRLAKKFPEYGFDIHKGYGTKFHYRMLKKFGPSEIHRKTFVKPLLKVKN